MKVLFTRFPLASRYGGAEVQTVSLMKGLMKRGHAAAFLGSCPTILDLCSRDGLIAAELQIGPPPVTKWHALSFAWRRGMMRKKLEAAIAEFGGLDAVCMLSLSEKLLLTPFALQKGIRVLWIEHDRAGRWLAKNPWLPALRRLSTSVTTVTVSERSREMLMDMGWEPERVVAIPNGIDALRIANNELCHDSFFILHDSLRVGTLARLSPDKGVDVLTSAVEGMPEASLTVVGTGSEEGMLRNWMATINDREALPSPRLRIIGHVENLGSFYGDLDAFVLASREHDPFGMAAAEAMLCKTATIVTNACGIAGYLENGRDALVVPAGDAQALREALKRLSNVEFRKRIAEQGQKTAMEKFSMEKMVDAYEQCLMDFPSLVKNERENKGAF
jgi:glycosyltransferase involved in cell wall biosynthesis